VALVSISSSMQIEISGEDHFYALEYELANQG